MQLYCDNHAAREIANNPVQHDCTKYVKVDRHFIEEKLDVVRSDEQLADVLTHLCQQGVFMTHKTSWALRGSVGVSQLLYLL